LHINKKYYEYLLNAQGDMRFVNLDLKSESPASANYNRQKRFALPFINSELLMNNSKPSKSSNCSFLGRERGIVLSPQGWQRFQVAKQQAESAQSCGKHLTQEDLSERTGLSLNTLYRVLKRELGVDRQSLEYLFGAFGLELTKADHTSVMVIGEKDDIRQPNSHQDWDNAVDTSIFYGRERELAQLWEWIVCNRCRVVGVMGMSGMGKSSIAVKAALQIQSEFEIVVWRSLTHAPPLTDLLSSLLKFLMPLYGEDPVIPPTLDRKFSKLMQYLRSRRCLLILDRVEVILDRDRVGQWSAGYEAYGQLLKTIGETPHQSCLLFTSCEQPSEITLMEGRQNTCAALSLKGLTPADGRAIFEQKGQFTGTTAHWQQLIHHYGGNPLMLKLVAAATRSLFDGDMAEVVADFDSRFEDISDLLDRQFDRLSTAEQKVLFCLAIHREPVSLARICESMIGLTPEQLALSGAVGVASPLEIVSVPKQLNSLIRRSIVEKTDGFFCLQPVVVEYITHYRP
jgi:transcriptional regulator with XRE-family HTH domain